MDTLQFNTDIKSYTLDELFSLLDIKITETSEVHTLKQLITERTQMYVKQFKDSKRLDLVEFMTHVQSALLGQYNAEYKNSSQETLIHFDNEYKPFTQDQSTSGSSLGSSSDLYDPNHGAGNPINRKTICQLLNVDSRFRDNYDASTPSDYLIYLPYTLQHVTEMKISDIELNTNYYPISDSLGNNYFWIATYTLAQLDPKNPNFKNPTLYYVYIPGGNYYFADLASYINSQLQAVDPDVPINCFVDLRYNNGIANGTGKTSIGVNSVDAITSNTQNRKNVKIELNFIAPSIEGVTSSIKVINSAQRELYNQKSVYSAQMKFGWVLGYRKETYGYDSNVLVHVSESVPNILGPPYLYLIVNDFNKNRNNHFIGTSSIGLLPNDIIARISVKASAFNIQSQNDFSVYAETRQYFGPVKINKLRIQLTDDYGRFIDLNHSDFSFTIRVTSVYSST